MVTAETEIYKLMDADTVNLEIELLIQAVFAKFQYDFRLYSRSSLRRRLEQAKIISKGTFAASLLVVLTRFLNNVGGIDATFCDLKIHGINICGIDKKLFNPRFF